MNDDKFKFKPEKRRFLMNSCGVTQSQIELLELVLPEAAELLEPKAKKENMERKEAKEKINRIKSEVTTLISSLQRIRKQPNFVDLYLSSSAEKHREFNTKEYEEKWSQKFDSINNDTDKLHPSQVQWLSTPPSLFSETAEIFLNKMVLICDDAIEGIKSIPQSHENTIVTVRLIEMALDRELKRDNKKDEDIVSEFYQAIGMEAGTKLKNYNEWRDAEHKNMLLRPAHHDSEVESTQESHKTILARMTGIVK
jgi:hypothetical protein